MQDPNRSRDGRRPLFAILASVTLAIIPSFLLLTNYATQSSFSSRGRSGGQSVAPVPNVRDMHDPRISAENSHFISKNTSTFVFRQSDVEELKVHGKVEVITGSVPNPSSGLMCTSAFGVLVPGYIVYWGKEKVDWSIMEAKTMFGVRMKFKKLNDVTRQTYQYPHCPVLYSVEQAGADYYEKAAVLSAVLESKDSFTMIEIGAGYGRWLLEGHGMVTLNRPELAVNLLGVEADPMTTEWATMAFESNSVARHQAMWMHGVAGTFDGTVRFERKNNAFSYGGEAGTAIDDAVSTPVPSFALTTIISLYWYVDHLDMDCNGCELELFSHESTVDMITERVRSIFIETHNEKAHAKVQQVLDTKGWKCSVELPFVSPNSRMEDRKRNIGHGDFFQEPAGFFWCRNPNYHLF